MTTPYAVPPAYSIGSLCSGYGGLDLAVEAVLGSARHAWHAETDPDASTILRAHWPDVPNLGDLTAAQFSAVEPVDILTAGYPCQTESLAGRRRGANDERWIWPDVARAVRMVRPRLVCLENVSGHLSLGFGRVVADLASLGYVGSWTCVRAADVGAPHRRERVFIVARPADSLGDEWRLQPVTQPGSGEAAGARADGPGGNAGVALLPTPTKSDGVEGVTYTPTGEGTPDLRSTVALLPTPQARDGDGRGEGSADYWDRRNAGRGNGLPLGAVLNLLPTPRATDGTKGGPNQRGSSGDLMLPSAVMELLPTPTVGDVRNSRNATAGRTDPTSTTNHIGWTLSDVAYADRWGRYSAAISRWEHVTGRLAPEPTEPGTKGQPRLSALFVEWMMGLPAGWVTDHVKRNAALKALGNGVVSAQGAHALRLLIGEQLLAHLAVTA